MKASDDGECDKAPFRSLRGGGGFVAAARQPAHPVCRQIPPRAPPEVLFVSMLHDVAMERAEE